MVYVKRSFMILSMKGISERILEARTRADLTLEEVGARLGISAQAVNQWEKGGKPSLDKLVPLVDMLGVSLDHLLRGVALPAEGSAVAYDRRRFAPVLNRVAAGKWNDVITPDSLPEGTLFLELSEKPIGDAIVLEIDGDSMLPEFRSGDHIIIDTGLLPVPGDFVVAVLTQEQSATFKKYRLRGYDDDGEAIVDLIPLDPDWPTLTIDRNRPGRILGTMIEHRRKRQARASAA